VLKRVTISAPEELLRRARLKAAEAGVSVSELFAQALEDKLRVDYRAAYLRMRRIKPVAGLKGARPFTRDEANTRDYW
jgi:hypothetical protein